MAVLASQLRWWYVGASYVSSPLEKQYYKEENHHTIITLRAHEIVRLATIAISSSNYNTTTIFPKHFHIWIKFVGQQEEDEQAGSNGC